MKRTVTALLIGLLLGVGSALVVMAASAPKPTMECRLSGGAHDDKIDGRVPLSPDETIVLLKWSEPYQWKALCKRVGGK